MQLISIVIPIFNEEKNTEILSEKIVTIFQGLPDYDYEIIFVNDGSTDNSYTKITNLARKNKKVKLLDFSRNFGNQIAVSAGYQYANGGAVINMDGDLQHPPELIPELISKWEQGNEIVIAKRIEDKHLGFFRRKFTNLYFKIFNKIANIEIEAGISDYRLLDRKVVHVLKNFTEKNRFFRGIINWIGFKKDYVSYRVDRRKGGISSFSFLSLFRLGFSGFTSFSLLPLRIAGYLGLLITGISFLLISYMIIAMGILKSQYFTPLAYLAVFNAFLIGVVLICLGFLALYVGNIYGEILNRPLFIVREKINFE